MDATLKIALIAAASAILGGFITGIIAPHINWGIEKRKQKLAHRRELIAKWREMIAEAAKTAPDGKLELYIHLHKDYYSLIPHLTKEREKSTNRVKSSK